MAFHTILHPTDFSDASRPAFAEALRLARAAGATLHLLHAAELTLYGPASGALAASDDEHRAALAALAGAARAAGVAVATTLRSGEAVAPTIVTVAEEEGADLIVLGTHGRRGLRRFFLGSVAEEVLREAPCPVLTVPARRAEAPHAPRAVLVPLDLSTASRQALALARRLAAEAGAVLHLLHVAETVDVPGLYGDVDNPLLDAFPEIHARFREEMEAELAATGGPDVPVKYHLEDGRPADVIVDLAAEEGIDLIVLTSHGRTGLSRFVMGSVAERVVRAAPCPVLTVKPT